MIELTSRQQEIVNNIMDENDDEYCYYLKGYAGTGKTITASYLACEMPALQKDINNILIVAPTATAMTVIQRKIIDYRLKNNALSGRTYFKTLASLIKQPVNKIKSDKGASFNIDDSGMQSFIQFLKGMKIMQSSVLKTIKGRKGIEYIVNVEELNKQIKEKIGIDFNFNLESDFVLLDPEAIDLSMYDLIIADEASMVNSLEMETLNKAVRKNEIKIVWVGDDKQLPPVEGKLSDDFKYSTKNLLTEILRSDDKIVGYASKIREGSINQLLPQTEITNDISQYLQDNLQELLEYDVCLTFKNKDVDLINKTLRANFTTSATLTAFEPIVITQNARNYMNSIIVFNSQRMIVEEIDTKEKTRAVVEDALSLNGIDDYDDDRYLNYERLINEDKLRLVKLSEENNTNSFWVLTNINLDSWRLTAYDRQVCEAIANICQDINDTLVYAYWKSAYAMTVHKSQGSEWNKVAYFYQINRFKFAQNNALDYTAVTRAKNNIKIVAFNS